MMIRQIDTGSIERTIEALVSAFAADPLIAYLFDSVPGREDDIAEFFRILMEVRVSLQMPAYLASEHGEILGAVMGYDTSRPSWPEESTKRWADLLNRVDGLAARLDAYEELTGLFAPPTPHYYLGVIGVREGQKGAGIGRSLLETFCAASSCDARSTGVLLETASESSLRFYLRNGFAVLEEKTLGGRTPLWCVFRETGANHQR